MAVIAPETRRVVSGLSAGDIEVLEQAVGVRELNRAGSGLDARRFALVKLTALIALDAPSASYRWLIANGLRSCSRWGWQRTKRAIRFR